MRNKYMQERTSAVILQLKEIRKKKGLTLQDVLDMVLESGSFLSMSSIKRVFSEGSENQSFRYEETIQPIARVLLEIEETQPNGGAEVEREQLAALKNVALLKEQLLDELRERNAALQEELDKVRAEAQLKIDFLKDQIQKKDAQIERQNKVIDRLMG